MPDEIRVLFIGDVVARAGRRVLKNFLPELKREYNPDWVIANVENIAGGSGVTPKVLQEIKDAGIDVMTSGNHIFDKKEAFECVKLFPELLRPLNYPLGVPGQGVLNKQKQGKKLTIINTMGRVFMGHYDCPFRTLKETLTRIKNNCILVDFHAETTSEKRAYALYFDGLVSAIIGTHTHVQTADEEILPKGTGYITDVGMTGGFYSVIGVEFEKAIERFLYQIPVRLEPAKEKPGLDGVFLTIDQETGKTRTIKRIHKT